MGQKLYKKILLLPVNLFQGRTNDFYREEFKKFVSNIEWRIKYKIPANAALEFKWSLDKMMSQLPNYC